MTPKQRAFIEAYAGNATEAAIKAGYSEKTAGSMGQQLLKKLEISKSIREREERRNNELIMNREERMIALSNVARDLDRPAGERIKAIDVLNKMSGEYLERVEAVTPASILAEVRRRRGAV